MYLREVTSMHFNYFDEMDMKDKLRRYGTSDFIRQQSFTVVN